jgi:hypothetical protein
MTEESLNSAGWWVLDLDTNPVPGDPQAIASLAVRQLNQGRDNALDYFARELDTIQRQAIIVLERGIQADRVYRSAAGSVCDLLGDRCIPGLDDPIPIWRGMTGAVAFEWAAEYAEYFGDAFPQVQRDAVYYGNLAASAEADRQKAIRGIEKVRQDYMTAVQRYAEVAQDAMPDSALFSE